MVRFDANRLDAIRAHLDSVENQTGRKLDQAAKHFRDVIGEVLEECRSFPEEFHRDVETLDRMVEMAMATISQHLTMSFDQYMADMADQ